MSAAGPKWWHPAQDSHTGIAEESPSAATVTPLPGGSVRLDYTWTYRGQPQRGSIHF